MRFPHLFARNIEAQDFLEDFLVAAIASILAIRFYLHLTGYPQIGAGAFHIAHMLWGGLLMLAALVILFSFLTKTSKYLAALVGGLGFGTFIDELGKFITKDNNYFFEPTIAYIYVIFILLYLISRGLDSRRKYSKGEYLINTLETLKEAVINDLDKDEENLARKYLKKANQDDPVVEALQSLLNHFEVIHKRKENILEKINRRFQAFYRKIIERNLFRRLLIIFFVFQAVGTILQTIIVTGLLTGHFSIFQQFYTYKFSEYGDLLFSTVSGVVVIFGVYKLVRSRLEAYQLFKVSVLITIFLTQFFVFYDIQFGALWGLLFNILILIALNALIDKERKLQKINRTIIEA